MGNPSKVALLAQGSHQGSCTWPKRDGHGGRSCSMLHSHPSALILPCASLGSLWTPVEAQLGFPPSWISAIVGFLRAASCRQGLRSSAGSSPLPTALPPAKLKCFAGLSVKRCLETFGRSMSSAQQGQPRLSPPDTSEHRAAALGLGVTELLLPKQHHLQSPMEANCLFFRC